MKREGKTIYFFLSITTVFFFINRLMLFLMVILGLILLFLMVNRGIMKIYANRLVKVFIAIAVLCILHYALNFFFPSYSIYSNNSYIIKEIARAIIYIFVIEVIMMIHIDINFYLKIWKGILVIVVGIAILQYVKLFDITSMLESFYGESLQFVSSESDDISSFRCGSVFVNANMFACYLAANTASYLSLLNRLQETIRDKLVFAVLTSIGFILSGSRTGMLVCVMILVYYLYGEIREGHIRIKDFLNNSLFVVFVVFSLFATWNFVADGNGFAFLSDLRMFKVQEGISNSFSIKLDNFWYMLKDMNALNILIGYGPYNYSASSSVMVDFDFGYFIVFFGIAGFLIYIYLIRGILEFKSEYLIDKRRLVMMCIVVCVFGFTAGVYFALRTFAVYLLMFLPIFTQDMQMSEVKVE